mmetsp:Transcript_27267/g.81777  ORF Transcript_27267/g.81777 Transcript_27267/m.81777 type:complete len:297 (-) Transcript_27267:22-912(-)
MRLALSKLATVAAAPGARRGLRTVPKMVSPLATSAKVFAGFNAAGLGISLASDTHVHLDLIGTGAFALAAVATRGAAADPKRLASTAAVAAWATRLAGFLFYRALTGGKDARLEDTLSTASGCVGFWGISFLWGWLTLLPHALGAEAGAVKSAGRAAALRRGGAALFGLGLATEVVADAQKFLFKKSHSGFCDVGVWSASQHPNWWGNLSLWSGIFLYNAPGLSGPKLALAAASPAFLAALFWAQATGALTPTVALAAKKYGSDPRYEKYLASTPLLVPNPVAWLAALGKALVGKW